MNLVPGTLYRKQHSDSGSCCPAGQIDRSYKRHAHVQGERRLHSQAVVHAQLRQTPVCMSSRGGEVLRHLKRLQITKFIGMLATGARGKNRFAHAQHCAGCRTGMHTETSLLLSSTPWLQQKHLTVLESM